MDKRIYLPNTTQTPNDILDIHMKGLSGSEFKVVMSILRKTLGWHKWADYISISQIMEATGLSNRQCIDCVNSLEQKGFIKTSKSKRRTTLITINFSEPSEKSSQGGEETSLGGEKSSLATSEKSSHTKHTNKPTNNKQSSSIPTLEEVIAYFDENGYTKEHATKMYQFYSASVTSNKQKYWKDSKGNSVRNWKQKSISVWFGDEGKKGDGGNDDAWSAQGFSPAGIL